ncbi:MAG: DUF2341 domain-containing protein [Cyclobacteriaceae bacterium]
MRLRIQASYVFRYLLLFIVSFLFLFQEALSQCQYEKSKTITINSYQVSGSTDLIDFPILISFTDTDVATNAQSTSGYDIRFMLKDCRCWLDHQIESYNSGTGEYVAWVRIPRLSASQDTEIEMYYGNSSVLTDPSTDRVWSSDYVGVWPWTKTRQPLLLSTSMLRGQGIMVP